MCGDNGQIQIKFIARCPRARARASRSPCHLMRNECAAAAAYASHIWQYLTITINSIYTTRIFLVTFFRLLLLLLLLVLFVSAAAAASTRFIAHFHSRIMIFIFINKSKPPLPDIAANNICKKKKKKLLPSARGTAVYIIVCIKINVDGRQVITYKNIVWARASAGAHQ